MGRKVTKAVCERVDEEIQMKMWNVIDALKRTENFSMDYVQIIELREIKDIKSFDNCYNQKIIYCRERPAYKEEIFLKVDNPVNAEVYIVDDSGRSIMMKALNIIYKIILMKKFDKNYICNY